MGDTRTLVSVFEDNSNDSGVRHTSSAVKVIFDAATPRSTQAADPGVDVLVSVSQAGSDKYKMEVEPVVGGNSTDKFTASEFVAVLSKRRECPSSSCSSIK